MIRADNRDHPNCPIAKHHIFPFVNVFIMFPRHYPLSVFLLFAVNVDLRDRHIVIDNILLLQFFVFLFVSFFLKLIKIF